MVRSRRARKRVKRTFWLIVSVVSLLTGGYLYYKLGGISLPLKGRPDNVRGIYLPTEVLADPNELDKKIKQMKRNRLNTVVIDFKNDYGEIVSPVESDDERVISNSFDFVNLSEVLKKLEKANIYPIARIVCFKDNRFSHQYPDYSFIDESGLVWEDAGGASYINPMQEEVKDYILEVTEAAYKIGFKEIQYDYIRFPEGFHVYSDSLWYDHSHYGDQGGYERIQAINDFLDQAYARFEGRDLKIGAAVFGYATIGGELPDLVGIGQNFQGMSSRVDVISAMIYPSHWSPGFAGVDYPDLEPFETIDAYLDVEKDILEETNHAAESIPWLQAFTDYSLAEGTYQEYGAKEINEQIKALKENGQSEFLLWNIAGEYPNGIKP